jgi:hypothetical protein
MEPAAETGKGHSPDSVGRFVAIQPLMSADMTRTSV